ncbi:hypothetical protein [Enterococcus faecalis]|uniref:hypothetical protein n=1 Tax=Enterococcus faecalis TaxID=1351 RepID=UPI0020913450|nr:hypothetical protein [Enterococcus faecalis]MCO5404442.1 hypothetical protein [Enterococcus faecalis]
MFSAEDGAMALIEPAVEKYESHFGKTFPLYEYIDMTQSEGWDFSVEGGKKLTAFIEERIKNDDPVEIPADYEDRTY